MPMRVPNYSCVVVRNGKNIRPKIGHAFDFTQEEIEHFLAADERNLRAPVNEVQRTAPRLEQDLPVTSGEADPQPLTGATRAAAAKRTAALAKRTEIVADEDEDEDEL